MTKTIILSPIVITAILAVLLPFMPQASADDTTCFGFLFSGTYDNVIVPAGSFCAFVSDVIVNGNVEVESNAILNALGATIVDGNINVADGASVHIHGITLGGTIQATNCNFMKIDF